MNIHITVYGDTFKRSKFQTVESFRAAAMVKTRSSAVSSRASSSLTQKPPCSSSSSSSCAPRKNRRRRTVAMPERKRKLRRQKALQKQIAIAKASQSVVTAEIGKKNTKSNRNSGSQQPFLSPKPSDNLKPNPTEACQKSTRKSFNIDKNDSPSSDRSLKSSRKRRVTVEEEKNPNSTQECRKSSRTREKRNQGALFQATCKKVRISEAAGACSGECDRDQVVEGDHGNGWTSEQDLALQNAYFQVRPSSNFWFEVSKKVSGKTAKDCFDRFYSAHPTPPTTQPRTRKLVAESPVRTISFPSPMPSLNCKVRFGRGKQGLLKAHQTVRHILRQQRVADGTYEADVFTAVEQSNPLLQDCTNRAISPLPALKGKDASSESLVGTPANCYGDAKSEWWSVSSKWKPRSGPDENTYTTRCAIKSQLLSPEVLKAERNPGRLDRFLDILHLRRVEKRKTPSAKGVSQGSQDNPKAEKTFTQCVAAAREAIITDATEVLKTAMQQKATEVEEETSFLSDHLEEESSVMSED